MRPLSLRPLSRRRVWLTPHAVEPSTGLSKILKKATSDAAAAAPDASTVHSLLSPPAADNSSTGPSATLDPVDRSSSTALHLSLSRPLMLQTNQREELRTAVAKVAAASSGCVHLCLSRHLGAMCSSAETHQSCSFDARYASFGVLENDDKSRRFLGVEIGHGYDQVRSRSLCPASVT